MIAHRRRTDDDGEEDGSVAAGIEDDSLSEGSVPSDVDDDADADGEGSDASEPDTPRKMSLKRRNGEKQLSEENGNIAEPAPGTKLPSFNEKMADTEAMMNGMKISGNHEDADEIHFDDAADVPDVRSTQPVVVDASVEYPSESLGDRRRREHEEYKKKRDEDPAFVPNRGGFFMHDHRVSAGAQNGFRPAGRGRGRGRGGPGFGGPFAPVKYV